MARVRRKELITTALVGVLLGGCAAGSWGSITYRTRLEVQARPERGQTAEQQADDSQVCLSRAHKAAMQRMHEAEGPSYAGLYPAAGLLGPIALGVTMAADAGSRPAPPPLPAWEPTKESYCACLSAKGYEPVWTPRVWGGVEQKAPSCMLAPPPPGAPEQK